MAIYGAQNLIQTNLDDVLELATQQKTSFNEKNEQGKDATLWKLKVILYFIISTTFYSSCDTLKNP